MMVVSFYDGVTHERLRTRTVYPKSLCIPSFGLVLIIISSCRTSLRPSPSKALRALTTSQIRGSTPEVGGTPIYGLYTYVWSQRVWFFSRFGHK